LAESLTTNEIVAPCTASLKLAISWSENEACESPELGVVATTVGGHGIDQRGRERPAHRDDAHAAGSSAPLTVAVYSVSDESCVSG